ncbi:hypothetical protein D3C80_1927030 [compost metagenome]
MIGTGEYRNAAVIGSGPLHQVGQGRHFVLRSMQQQTILREWQWLIVALAGNIPYRQPQQRDSPQPVFEQTGNPGKNMGTERKTDQ